MKRLLLLLLLAPLCTIAHGAAERRNTVLIHPGEVIYARFSQLGVKLKLVKASKEKDDNAQVILTFDPVNPAKKNTMINLKVENRFTQDFHYKAQMRSLTKNKRMMAMVYPVVAGKISLVPLLPGVEELAAYDFELEP